MFVWGHGLGIQIYGCGTAISFGPFVWSNSVFFFVGDGVIEAVANAPDRLNILSKAP